MIVLLKLLYCTVETFYVILHIQITHVGFETLLESSLYNFCVIHT